MKGKVGKRGEKGGEKEKGSPLNGEKSGEAAEPQWQSKSWALGYAFPILTAPLKVVINHHS